MPSHAAPNAGAAPKASADPKASPRSNANANANADSTSNATSNADGPSQAMPGPVDEDEPLPPGHPKGPAGANPHGGGAASGGAGQTPGVFEPPPDTTDEALDLPPGTIVANIVDAMERPIGNIGVTMGIVNNTVAKGESRKHIARDTDAKGELRFDHLETESHIAYRVTVPKDGGVFAAPPFRLPEKHGMRVKLHVYPVTHDVEQALIVTQTIIYVEMKDDRVQIQEMLSVWNFGQVAWVPQALTLSLPPSYTGFSAQQGMTDTGVDNIEKVGVRVRGTFTPGRHEIEFRWQLPYNGESDVSIDVGMPPHLAAVRAMAPAARQMTFTGTGFPAAIPRTDNQGQRVLISEKQLTRGEPPLKTAHLELRDLPTQGPGRYYATSLAGLVLASGIALGLRTKAPRDKGREKKDARELRKRLLVELSELEEAHASGEVGPQTYARARRELIDQIALTFSPVV
jgi:hypothetical protein